MKRVVVIVVIVGVVCVGGAYFYLRTCCAPPPTSTRDEPGAKPSATAAPVAPAARVGPDAPVASGPTPRAARPTKAAPAAAAPSAPEASAAPTAGTLRIVSDVAGAQVFLNREFVGATPATAGNLKPGSYQLNVAAPGFDNHVETIEVAAGEHEISIKFREVRLDATIEVVHKHRLGSCKGQLIATPQGVRYETANKDDAFAASLGDLETFQVDYLEKNLRIQPRKGKRYDFTDPAGNADKLFVFHRDVERARERMRTQ